MSTVVVLGANGTAGRPISQEAHTRGHRVLGVVRDPATADLPAGVEARRGDALDADSLTPTLADADAVVVAVGGGHGAPWLGAAQAVAHAVRAVGTHPYVVHLGGGATLLGPDGTPILDSPGFPAEFREPAEGQAAALAWYRSEASGLGLRWTYLSPPPVDFAPGVRTGDYRTGSDSPVVDRSGTARISYEDLAVALVDEIESPRFEGRRFTVGY